MSMSAILLFCIGVAAGDKIITENAEKRPASFINSVGIEFVLIPAGEFLMGCSSGDNDCDADEKPSKTVKTEKAYYIGKYEITQGQWKAVMGDNRSFHGKCGDSCPAEQISWEDVQEFIGKLCDKEDSRSFLQKISFQKSDCRYRLPTEAEWEYAARGSDPKTGNKSRYGDINEIGWYNKNSQSKTHPVGQKKPNSFGLFDMLGNVWEWTLDIPAPDSGRNAADRIRKGGAYNFSDKMSRVSGRAFSLSDSRSPANGFRLAVQAE